jgi:exo-beta-1,3-glucanase (GH17 family)
MRFTSIITIALSFAGLIQALPIESRSINGLYGVTYTARNSDGSCQSASEITNAVHQMKAAGINNIRTYSQECNQLPAILNAIKSNGGDMTVLAAVWIDGTSNDNDEIATLKQVLNSTPDLSPIRGILVGNEVLFQGLMPSSELVSKVKAVKAIAKGIKVGSAEVDTTYSEDLMAASDIVCANIQPFFSHINVKNAASNLNMQYNNFKKTAGGKEVYVTETGWPSSGADAGDSHPSVANMETFAVAVSKISLPYYFFEWQDSQWKSSGIESSFGLIGADGKAKFAF